MGLNRRRDLPAWRLRSALRRQRVNFKFTEILAFTFLSNLTQDKLKTSKGVFLKRVRLNGLVDYLLRFARNCKTDGAKAHYRVKYSKNEF